MKAIIFKLTYLLTILGPLAVAEFGLYPVSAMAYNLSYFLAVLSTWLFVGSISVFVASAKTETLKKPRKFPHFPLFIMMFFAMLGWYWLASGWACIALLLIGRHLAAQSKKEAKE